MPKIAIVIPARFGSSRFPGKPLAMIGGKSMLQRVCELAWHTVENLPGADVQVATEDERIAAHAKEIGAECVMTSDTCRTGSDRVLEAIESLPEEPDFVVNLQGDAPFTPHEVLRLVISTWLQNPDMEVVTPVVQLSWHELDILREHKKTTPFSGTTCIRDPSGKALWFSKNIIPAIRKENSLRSQDSKSPVFQHIGLYGFRTNILKRFVSLQESCYEGLEGLEQLRLLENGITIQTVAANVDIGAIQAGIDSPEDIERAEKMLADLRF